MALQTLFDCNAHQLKPVGIQGSCSAKAKERVTFACSPKKPSDILSCGSLTFLSPKIRIQIYFKTDKKEKKKKRGGEGI